MSVLLYFLPFSSCLHLPHFICSVHSVSLEILSPPLPPNSVTHPLPKTHTQSGRGRRPTPSHTSLRYTCADVPSPSFVHLLRDSLQMCTTCTYVNVCTDSHGKITFMDSRAVLCCYLSNSHAAFWSNLDPPQAYRSLVYTPLALTSSRCTCILLL